MSNLPRMVKKNLTDILREEGLLKDDILAQAVARQKQSNLPLHRVLHQMGVLTEHELARALSRQLGLPYLDASSYLIPKESVGVIDLALMDQNQMVLLQQIGRALVVATAGPPPQDVVESIEKSTGCVLFFYISTVAQVEVALTKYFKTGPEKPPAPAAPAVQKAQK